MFVLSPIVFTLSVKYDRRSKESTQRKSKTTAERSERCAGTTQRPR